MLKKLIVLPVAERDIAETLDWYESQEAGLGLESLRCVEVCFKNIERHPDMYPLVYKTYHRALVRRFPYTAYYKHEEKHILVFGIMHCAQNPEKWQTRLP
jgi:plasmid stabilization system protein ParE